MAIVQPRNISSILGHLASYRNLSEVGRQRAVETVSQMPLRLQQIVLNRIAQMRAERFAESQASKARKEGRLTMGLGAGLGAVGGGLTGGLLAPAGKTALSVGLGAGIGATGGAAGALLGSPAAAGIPSVGQAFQPLLQQESQQAYLEMLREMFTQPTTQRTAGLEPTGTAEGAAAIQAAGYPKLVEPTATQPAARAVTPPSTLEQAVEEPAGAALVTPTAMRRATERIKAIGKQRMAEGNADEAIRLAKLLVELGVAA